MNYKDFVSGLDENEYPGLTSPKKRKVTPTLKKPSRTRIAAQKKIQQAHTQRLCSPPPPSRITTATTPDCAQTTVITPSPTPIEAEPIAAPDPEMNEAANTLLSLSGEAEGSTTETVNIETHEPEQTSRPPVAFEVNVTIDPGSNQVEIKPNQIIGSAIKE